MGNQVATDLRFRSGTNYWHFDCPQFAADQNALATEVDGGVWRLDPIDFSAGDAKYVEWGHGKLTYDDLHVTFLKNNNTQSLWMMAETIATGKNNSANRFNCSLVFTDSGTAEQMRINYNDCQIVSVTSNGFGSDDHDSAGTETVTFRPSIGEVIG